MPQSNQRSLEVRKPGRSDGRRHLVEQGWRLRSSVRLGSVHATSAELVQLHWIADAHFLSRAVQTTGTPTITKVC